MEQRGAEGISMQETETVYIAPNICKNYLMTPGFNINSMAQKPGGGGNYHICRYGMCHFFGVPFFEQKINFGVSFLVKSQVVINFWVSF